MSQENKFADGLYFNEPHENAPEFVLGNISVNVEQFAQFLKEQEVDDKGYLKLSILRSKKTNKPYIVIDTWKPEKRDTEHSSAPVEENTEEITDDTIENVPF